MYTRIPDFTQARASFAVLSRFLYSISHDIDILLAPLEGPQRSGFMRSAGDFFFVPHSGIINRAVKKHLEHLQQFQFPHDLDCVVHHGFAFEELPKIFLGENNGLHNLAQRDALLSAARTDFAVAMLNVEFVLAEQPLAQVAVDFVDSFLELVDGNVLEVGNLRGHPGSFFQPLSERIGVRFDQTNESVREHHTHPSRPPSASVTPQVWRPPRDCSSPPPASLRSRPWVPW